MGWDPEQDDWDDEAPEAIEWGDDGSEGIWRVMLSFLSPGVAELGTDSGYDDEKVFRFVLRIANELSSRIDEPAMSFGTDGERVVILWGCWTMSEAARIGMSLSELACSIDFEDLHVAINWKELSADIEGGDDEFFGPFLR